MEINLKSGFAALIGKRMQKKFKFCGEDVTISKLSVSEVKKIQELAKDMENKTDDDDSGFDVLKLIIKSAVEGAADISDTDFEQFPMDELSKLSSEIMKYSGIGQDQGK